MQNHIPVLLNEVIEYLDPKPNENFIDCTLGFAGHVAAILERTSPGGKVLGIELDTEVLEEIQERMAEFSIFNGSAILTTLSLSKGFQFSKDRLILVNDSYANLKEIAEKENFGPVSGILFDLGMSSWHIDKSARGFSFQKDEPLDMRYAQIKNEKLKIKNHNSKFKNLTAEEIVNEWSEQEIARILREYGQERFAKHIAKKIIESRKVKPIQTTFQLKEIIKKSFPKSYKFGKLHVATRTFQALRMAVNNELENLKTGLTQALQILEQDGKIAVISFHSLEDSIVKKFFKQEAKNNQLQIITKKPIQPALQEIKQNPRSRSAKLRVAEKI